MDETSIADDLVRLFHDNSMARKLVLTQCHPLTQRPKAHRLRMVQGTGSPGSVCRSTSPRSRGQPAAIRSKGIQNMSEWFLQDASIELKVQAFLDQTPVVNIGSSWIGWIQHHAFFTVLVRTRPMARHDFGSRKVRREHPLKPGTTWLPAEAVCPCLTHPIAIAHMRYDQNMVIQSSLGIGTPLGG